MIYRVSQRIAITYARALGLGHYNVRLRPVAWPGQRVLDYRLDTDPEPLRAAELPAPWPVNTDRLTIGAGADHLTVTSSFTVAVEPPPLPVTDTPLAEVRREALAARSLGPRAPAGYLFGSPLAPLEERIGEWASPCFSGGAEQVGVLGAARALASAIHADFRYQPGATTITTTPLAAFRARAGVCQDFAAVMIVALRHHGIPAAYVSGYLRTDPPEGRPRLVGADAMHAWVKVWCGPQAGWIGIDPTNDCLAGDAHIAVAMGRDYGDVSPIDGVFIGSRGQAMKVAVDVVPIAEQVI